MSKNQKISKIYTFYLNFSKAYYRKYISDFAASAAFFLFLSMIPLMMLAFSILPFTDISEDIVLYEVLKLSPDNMDSFIRDIINEIYFRSAGVITVTIIVTLWSAGKAMNSLIRGLNSIDEIEENRGYFLLRGVACLYTIIMLAAVIIMFGLLMFGRSIIRILLEHFPKVEVVWRLILHLRYPVAFIVLVLIFTVIYCLVPSKKQHFIKQLPGAFFSAFVWGFASWIFSVYVEMYDGFSTYGSLATVIIVMVYMYMMMYIMLYGAYLNHWLGRSDSGSGT